MAEAPRRAPAASLRQTRVADWGLEPPGVLEIRNSRSYSYRLVGASKFQLRDKGSRAAGLSKGVDNHGKFNQNEQICSFSSSVPFITHEGPRAAGLSKGAQPVPDQPPGAGPVLVLGWAGRPGRRPGRRDLDPWRVGEMLAVCVAYL